MVTANITHRNDGLPERVTTLEALLWEDLRFPANAVNLAGSATPPGTNTSTFYGALDFSGGPNDNDIAILAQMPHGWANGTEISPHLHIVNTGGNGGASVWELYVRKADVGEEFGAYVLHQSLTFTPNTSQTMQQLAAFDHIDMAGLGDSAMLAIWLRRKGNDANTGIITLLEFDIHYQSATRGSVNETGER